MKRDTIAMSLLTGLVLGLFAFTASGCSHSSWVSFEQNTRLAGVMTAPMGLVNMIGKVGRLVTSDDGVPVATCHDCESSTLVEKPE